MNTHVQLQNRQKEYTCTCTLYKTVLKHTKCQLFTSTKFNWKRMNTGNMTADASDGTSCIMLLLMLELAADAYPQVKRKRMEVIGTLCKLVIATCIRYSFVDLK